MWFSNKITMHYWVVSLKNCEFGVQCLLYCSCLHHFMQQASDLGIDSWWDRHGAIKLSVTILFNNAKKWFHLLSTFEKKKKSWTAISRDLLHRMDIDEDWCFYFKSSSTWWKGLTLAKIHRFKLHVYNYPPNPGYTVV